MYIYKPKPNIQKKILFFFLYIYTVKVDWTKRYKQCEENGVWRVAPKRDPSIKTVKICWLILGSVLVVDLLTPPPAPPPSGIAGKSDS